MCSTVDFFMYGRSSTSATTSSSTASSSSVHSLLSNTLVQVQQAQKAQTSKWFQLNYFHYLNLGWRCLVGVVCLAYCRFFKTKDSEGGTTRFLPKFNNEQKLWFFSAIFKPALDFFAHSLSKSSRTDIAQIISLISFVLYFVAIYLYIKRSMNVLSSNFRFLFWDADRQFSWERFRFFGSKIGLVFVTEIIVTVAFTKLIQLLLPSSQVNQSENQKQIQEALGGTRLIMTVISVLIFAPVFEELIYRRSILKTSDFHFSTVLSSAIIFGLIHLDGIKGDTIFHIVPYFLGGLVFAWSYRKYRNIWISIFAHFLHNLIALFSTLANSVT